ncbi:ferrous iron transport protein A [Candidatus Thorarchaeota archaeon]|nr:MAG: ferrous iron transport protein A [Candidatus Thorarchaeota archaeon]
MSLTSQLQRFDGEFMANGMRNHKGQDKLVPLTSVSSGSKCVLAGFAPVNSTLHAGAQPKGHGRRMGRRHRSHANWHRREREVMRRLLDLGLTKGCSFEVVQGSDRGPVLLEIRGTRIALGQSLARRLLVKEI